MPEVLSNLLSEIVYAIIIVVVPILAKYVVSFLSSKKAEIDANTGDIVFSSTLSDAVGLIQSTVDMVSQTYVDALKNAGKFTDEAQKEAFNKALETSKNLMSSETKDLLSTAYDDLDAWIQVQIESYIKSKKEC